MHSAGIKVVDFDSLWKERDETKRQAEEELSREREAAIRKLLEAGVSREQLATAGLLEPAE